MTPFSGSRSLYAQHPRRIAFFKIKIAFTLYNFKNPSTHDATRVTKVVKDLRNLYERKDKSDKFRVKTSHFRKTGIMHTQRAIIRVT